MAEPVQTVPDEWIEKAFLLLSDYGVPGDNPAMSALLENQLQVAAGATRTQTFSAFARKAGVPLAASYNPITPEVIAWARANSSALVKQVTDATRRGIAEVIATAIQEMQGVDEAKRMVRTKLLADKLSKRMGIMAGLDANRIKSVLTYEESLLANGYSAKDAERMTATFAKRQLADRSKVIAQTEMRRSVESATIEAEREAGAREKRWLTVNDNRVAPEDAANQAQGWVDLDKPFQSGHTEPPGHPRCRCTLAFREQPFDRIVADLRQRGVLAPAQRR